MTTQKNPCIILPSSKRRRPPIRFGIVDDVDGGAIVVGVVIGRERTVVVVVGLMLKTGNWDGLGSISMSLLLKHDGMTKQATNSFKMCVLLLFCVKV